MVQIRPLVAGNWKMNGLKASRSEADRLAHGLTTAPAADTDVMICPPATLLAAFAAELPNAGIQIGGQDCHANASGAHTGDVAAEMIADSGATAVIVGHSERRTDHGETDATVLAKAEAAHRAGLVAIICIGETRDQREAGTTLNVLRGQLEGSVPGDASASNTVVAYEPVWAIGTGLTPTTDDVAEAHGAVRQKLVDMLGEGAARGMRILYGGSVKPANAQELMAVPDVNGALVGGASLKADDFLGIIAAYRPAQA